MPLNRSRHGNGNGQEESFTQRSAMHEQQRRVRVERLRQMKQETELSACTFAPSICETSKSIFKKSSVRQKQQQASGGADSCSAASSHEQALSRRSSSASGPFDESYDYLQQLDQEEDAAYLHQPPAPGFPRGAGALFEDSAAFFERYHSDEGEDDSAAASLPGGVQCSWPASRDRSPQHELIRDLTAANGVIYDEPRRALGTYDPVTFVAADKCTSSSLPSDSDNAFESSDDANNEPLPPRPVFSKSLDASYAQNAQNALLNWRRLSSKLDDDA
ncbi:hypothetical protein DIPPA_21261 [Diplonema papillatum]|nr:hypothetical protein DIPPA_21260 [Diplonema papillatum]KAJ9435501.1 hypothetical protein DIPPA_21261 [Diplonema papillatum]